MCNKSFISIFCLLILFDPFMNMYMVLCGKGFGSGFGSGGGGGKDDDKSLQNFESFGGGGSSFGGGSSGESSGAGKKGKKGGKGGKSEPKNSHSFGMKFYDDLAATLFPLGDKSGGGLPDSVPAMSKYCAEFVTNGAALLAYTTARYPQKVVFKMVVAVGTAGLIGLNAVYCANPVAILHYTQMAKIVNTVNDELVKIKDEFAVRCFNAFSKMDNQDDKHKQACCAFVQYKKKTVEAVPEEAREFVRTMLEAHFIMPQRAFCQEIQDDTYQEECGKWEYNDEDPDYPLMRSLYAPPTYIITEYM